MKTNGGGGAGIDQTGGVAAASSGYQSSDNSSRPSSRQKKSKRELGKVLAAPPTETLLPTFYENINSYQQQQQKLQRLDSVRGRSESPADRLMYSSGRSAEGADGRGDALHNHHRLSGRPRSQLGGGVLYGSTRSRRTASPAAGGGIHSAPGTSIASMCTSGRHHGRYSTLHTAGVGGYVPAMDLAEAEVESDPDQASSAGGGHSHQPPPHERNLLIEYSSHVPYHHHTFTQDTPILSSLTSQSLRGPSHANYKDQQQLAAAGFKDQLFQLSEPISPPKQFDSSPQPGKAGREGAY